MTVFLESFLPLVEDPKIRHFCLDASGVLYNKPQGLIPGVLASIRRIRSLGKSLFLVTNNSMKSAADISLYLSEQKLDWPASHIFSSGLGCSLDSEMFRHLKGKKVYVSGDVSSLSYLDAFDKTCFVSSFDGADCIILLSNPQATIPSKYADLCAYLRLNPHVSVFCCNPDRFVLNQGALLPVMGYWADYISMKIARPVYYFGKPYPAYFSMVSTLLAEGFGITDLTSCCYVDDFIDNLKGCELPFVKVWARDTGLGVFFNSESVQIKNVDYVLSSIAC
ncbi:MAG: hypothetical protein VW378_00715 [bacterium]